MKYSVKDLREGMIVKDDIVVNGHAIVRRDTELTFTLIKALRDNEVKSVDIKSQVDVERDAAGKLETITDAELSMLFPNMPETEADLTQFDAETVRNSADFKVFHKAYLDKVMSFENELSDFLLHQDTTEPQKLLKSVKDIFETVPNASSYEMLNMLLCVDNLEESTYTHSLNVAVIARILGMWLGWSEKDLDILTLGGLLHDIGKTKIDSAILFKKEKLTNDEFEIIKKHSTYGYNMVKDNKHLPPEIKLCILQHHEKVDGSGYPLGVKGDKINRFAKIITVADVYDAMTAKRCYRDALSPFEAVGIIQKESYAKYDVVAALTFLSHIVTSYLGERALLSDNRQVRILKMNNLDMKNPLVIDEKTNKVVDLSKSNAEIIKIL